ncbi:MAG: PF20097 family protein [Gemmiger formicilis]|uniref:PF20097 family protein n=1 Tax=Gemmiger formicilis TaxID=745368 RepID=UPI0039A3C33D
MILDIEEAACCITFFFGQGKHLPFNGAADNSNTVFAFKCEDCKKIIIDYSSER